MQFRYIAAALNDAREFIAQVNVELDFALQLEIESERSLAQTKQMLARSQQIIENSRKLLSAQRFSENN